MEALKINNPKLGHKIFHLLLKKVVCDTEDDMETVGFSSKWMNYEISFYVNIEDVNNLILDDFGFMENMQWIQCQPTEEQIKNMLQIITEKLDQLYSNNKETDDDFDGDFYKYYGISSTQFL